MGEAGRSECLLPPGAACIESLTSLTPLTAATAKSSSPPPAVDGHLKLGEPAAMMTIQIPSTVRVACLATFSKFGQVLLDLRVRVAFPLDCMQNNDKLLSREREREKRDSPRPSERVPYVFADSAPETLRYLPRRGIPLFLRL